MIVIYYHRLRRHDLLVQQGHRLAVALEDVGVRLAVLLREVEDERLPVLLHLPQGLLERVLLPGPVADLLDLLREAQHALVQHHLERELACIMRVCMFMYIYIYIYIHYVYIYIYIYIERERDDTLKYVYVHTCVYTYVYIYIYICLYCTMYVCIYI